MIPIGDIGKVKRKIELEPLPEHAPLEQPTTAPAIPAPAPAEPEKVPA